MSGFDSAAEAVVGGDVDTLRALLRANASLATARSPKHGATLLHYVGANGPVEDDLQRTPPNAVEVAQVLFASGAEVDAIIEGDRAATPLVSLITSEFPAEAGVQGELTRLFVKQGAAVNGLDDNGYPLACALSFGYPDAIAALLDSGARVDNVVSGAALGLMSYVRTCFDDAGRLTHRAGKYPDPFRREFEEKEVVRLAVEHAEQYERRDVLAFLASVAEP